MTRNILEKNECSVLILSGVFVAHEHCHKSSGITVIQGHWFWYQWKPVCDFLLVNNTNLHPISQRFQVIAD